MPKKEKRTAKKNTPRKLTRWLTLQNLVFIVVIVIFVITIIWSEPISQLFSGVNIKEQIKIPTPTNEPGEPTPLPPDYYSTTEQTNGIILGAVMITIIVLAGTIGVLIRDKA
jgi:hypothetical protein